MNPIPIIAAVVVKAFLEWWFEPDLSASVS
jgi:hypothetical protein